MADQLKRCDPFVQIEQYEQLIAQVVFRPIKYETLLDDNSSKFRLIRMSCAP